jgi:hypothetical protein
MKGLLAILGPALIGVMLVTGADANNPEPVTVGMDFVDPITITEVSALRYGVLDEALNLETIIIATNDGVSGTGTALILGGTQAAADLTIAATASQTLSILVDNPLPGAGYTLTLFRCKYAAEADAACDVGGYTATAVGSGTLKIGATLTGDNTATAGNADGSFDVTVTYQ